MFLEHIVHKGFLRSVSSFSFLIKSFSRCPLRSRSVLALICICLLAKSRAQNPSNSVVDFYKHYTTNEGLSSNTCLSLLEDSRGFVWIGTAEGLNRFDGHRFRKFFNDPNSPNSICGNTVVCLDEDIHGRIWIGSYGSGVTVFDPLHEEYEQYRMEAPGLPLTRSNRVEEIVVLDDDRVFCSTEGGLFLKLQGDSVFKLVDAAFLGLQEFDIKKTRILHDRQRNGIWIYTVDGVLFYHCDTGIADHVSKNVNHWRILDESGIYNIQLDHQNRIWYLKYQSDFIYLFEPESNVVISYDLSRYQSDQATKMMYSKQKDAFLLGYWNQPALFVSAEDGSVSIEPFTQDYPGSIGNARMNDVMCDGLNLEWIATGKGLYVRRGDQPVRELNWIQNPDLVIKDVYPENELVWIATNAGLIKHDRNSKVETTVCSGNIDYLYFDKGVLLLGKDEGIYKVSSLDFDCKPYLLFSDTTRFSFARDAIQFMHRERN